MERLIQAKDVESLEACSLVPTMGALHAGHASLVRRARADADALVPRPRVVVTLFVNPTQFGAGEDFERYPRTLEADAALAAEAGADVMFIPGADMIYPRGLDAARHDAATFPVPPSATEPGLEDRVRPGHFGGVCLVVARLFELCRPRRADFGEKDWQQLRVISEWVERERAGSPYEHLEVIPCATIREPDGLAMSSRNRYLSREVRQRATALWRAIDAVRKEVGAFKDAPRVPSVESTSTSPSIPDRTHLDELERQMSSILRADGLKVDYAVIRERNTLLSPSSWPMSVENARVLVAARLDGVRLIDNAPLLVVRNSPATA